MSKKPLVGKNFLKYDREHGLETCYVLDHDEEQGVYVAAFIEHSIAPQRLPAIGPGRIQSTIAQVTESVLESYANQNQKALKALRKLQGKVLKKRSQVLAPAASTEPEQIPF